MKDTAYYNQESKQYSERRYPQVPRSYTQFFYKYRLELTKRFLRTILASGMGHPTLLEIGCADGIIIRSIEAEFPNKFKKLVGIDIASNMIEEARSKNTIERAVFTIRDQYEGRESVDVVVETGVVNYAHVEEELAFAHTNLVPGGFYILSIAGTDSLLARLKGAGGFNDFRSYSEYDRLLKEKFTTVRVRGCGLFIPYIWRIPPLGRAMQTLVEPIVGVLIPSLCHEKVYLLKKKESVTILVAL